MFDAIFHPTDLSQPSVTAFAAAVRLALQSEAELRVAHVESGEPNWSDWPLIDELLGRWGEAVGNDRKIRAKLVQIDARRPHAPLLEEITHFRPDLLVLRSHGRAGIERLFRGSVSEGLIRAARVPALVLPDGARVPLDEATGTFQVRRVLIPVAPTPTPAAARNVACEFLAQLEQRSLVQELHIGHRESAPFRSEAPPESLSWEKDVLPAQSVVPAILQRARDFEADLIVMASRGHDGAMDAVFGSTTEQVMRSAPCPVLVVPQT